MKRYRSCALVPPRVAKPLLAFSASCGAHSRITVARETPWIPTLPELDSPYETSA